jgi:hypothetical protein
LRDLLAAAALLAADGFERFLDEIVLVWLDALLRLWRLMDGLEIQDDEAQRDDGEHCCNDGAAGGHGCACHCCQPHRAVLLPEALSRCQQTSLLLLSRPLGYQRSRKLDFCWLQNPYEENPFL